MPKYFIFQFQIPIAIIGITNWIQWFVTLLKSQFQFLFDEKRIFQWSDMTGQQKAKLDSHSRAVNSLSFSRDGTTLSSGGNDMSIYLWNVKQGKQKANLICFSQDGTTLASSDDNSIRLWNVKSRFKVKKDDHSSYVYQIEILQHLVVVITLSFYGILIQVNKQLNQMVITILSYQASSSHLIETIIAFGNFNNSIRCWRIMNGKKIKTTNQQYQQVLDKFQNRPLSKCVTYPQLLISKYLILQAQGAFIFKGEFANYQFYDFQPLLKSKGSQFLEK
ncbi:unnamed protein product [Paramecium sonneborni]|uniref:Uncharacterized protein n=1 Tax=Paramecium sonneborni TaxID=65129 RepID=A0A8S1PR33_9CILI|nr:unnamed protein product [Paramecium sonneborni]